MSDNVYTYDRFITRKFHTSQPHVPKTGLGCFEAEFHPKTGLLDIRVRVTPRVAGIALDHNLQNSFMSAFETGVEKVWNGKFQFVLTKPGFKGLVVTPRMSVIEENDITKCHYDLKIVTSSTGNACVRTEDDPGIYNEGMKAKGLRDQSLRMYQNKLSAQFDLLAIEAQEIVRATDIFVAMKKSVTIAIAETDTNAVGANFSYFAMERLRTIARDIGLVFQDSNKRPKVTIVAASETAADSVKNIISRFGLQAEFAVRSGNAAGLATISVDKDQLARLESRVMNNINMFPQFGQQAAVHEFGHMIGLPDEYICPSENAIGLITQLGLASGSDEEGRSIRDNPRAPEELSKGQEKTQKEFIKLCNTFGVPAPPFGQHNANIMSVGEQIQPCHATTIAYALWHLTKHYTEPKDWQIKMTG